MSRVAVIGGGAWGTVFARICADAGASVCVLEADSAVVQSINHHSVNQRSVPHMPLPSHVQATTDPAEALAGAELVAVALRAQQARGILADLASQMPPNAVVMSLMKGLEQGTMARMSQVLGETLGLPEQRVAVLSGPNLAMELAERHPGATVVACQDEAVAREVGAVFATEYWRPYSNPDVVGVEVCGVVKNVVALALGAAKGMGYGMNTLATFMTRGLAEMTRLGLALGADLETFSGMAGVGDLVATCLSSLSRNHSVGLALGQGLSMDQALAQIGGTAESITSAPAVLDLATSMGVEMPITEGVVAVVQGGASVAEMGRRLLTRPYRSEGARYEPWSAPGGADQ
ncbi:MAG: NAD(P)-dependent glycerol-3-phosphate dehydrogenase [Micrococcales bacterium]|nr:NAD(P)-dependent glycerol-3-phosphate dehydrogenase [Micrococcales bacterium]